MQWWCCTSSCFPFWGDQHCPTSNKTKQRSLHTKRDRLGVFKSLYRGIHRARSPLQIPSSHRRGFNVEKKDTRSPPSGQESTVTNKTCTACTWFIVYWRLTKVDSLYWLRTLQKAFSLPGKNMNSLAFASCSVIILAYYPLSMVDTATVSLYKVDFVLLNGQCLQQLQLLIIIYSNSDILPSSIPALS